MPGRIVAAGTCVLGVYIVGLLLVFPSFCDRVMTRWLRCCCDLFPRFIFLLLCGREMARWLRRLCCVFSPSWFGVSGQTKPSPVLVSFFWAREGGRRTLQASREGSLFSRSCRNLKLAFAAVLDSTCNTVLSYLLHLL